MKFKNQMIDKIFVFFWTIWCVLIFIIAMSVFIIFFFIGVNIPSKRLLRAMHFFPVRMAELVLWLFGIQVKIHHLNLIDKHKQYILISNHTSYIDALVSAKASRHLYKKYIGKAEILNYPILGYLLKKIYVPVQRDNKNSRKKTMKKLHQFLTDGVSLVIYPEGTCNTSGKLLKEFKNGAFNLSIQTKIPIAIFTTVNAKEIMPRKGLKIRPGVIDVYWDTILYPENYSLETLDKMKSDAKETMIKHLV